MRNPQICEFESYLNAGGVAATREIPDPAGELFQRAQIGVEGLRAETAARDAEVNAHYRKLAEHAAAQEKRIQKTLSAEQSVVTDDTLQKRMAGMQTARSRNALFVFLKTCQENGEDLQEVIAYAERSNPQVAAEMRAIVATL